MTTITSALIKILGANGAAGNGFVCQGGRVVTCAHVVAKALGTGDGSEEARPTGSVKVQFHWLDGMPERQASVIPGAWRPKVPNQAGIFDIAILRISEGLPKGVEPLVLARGIKEGFDIQFVPYIPSIGSSSPITGKVMNRNEYNRLVLRADSDFTQFVEPGVSGAAVFAVHGEVVEGVVERRDTAVPQAFLCPASAIRSVLAEIEVAEDTAAYRFETEEDRNRYANRRAAVFDIYAPSQLAQPGAGVELQLSASFGRTDAAQLALREVEIQLEPPRNVTARRGRGERCVVSGIAVEPFDIPRRPAWRLSAAEGATLSGLVEVDMPPLCVLPDPRPGEEIRARMTTFAHGVAAPDLEELDLPEVKKRIIERLRLKQIGDPGEDGDILLGMVAGRVRETPR